MRREGGKRLENVLRNKNKEIKKRRIRIKMKRGEGRIKRKR